MVTRKYGNVEFGETSVVIAMPYKVNPNPQPRLDEKAKARALDCAKNFLRGRMNHCMDELNANLSKATFLGKENCEVGWAEGHFSGRVYDAMEAALAVNSWNQFNKLQLQQIVRALHFNNPAESEYYGTAKTNAFNIATELLLVGNPGVED